MSENFQINSQFTFKCVFGSILGKKKSPAFNEAISHSVMHTLLRCKTIVALHTKTINLFVRCYV